MEGEKQMNDTHREIEEINTIQINGGRNRTALKTVLASTLALGLASGAIIAEHKYNLVDQGMAFFNDTKSQGISFFNNTKDQVTDAITTDPYESLGEILVDLNTKYQGSNEFTKEGLLDMLESQINNNTLESRAVKKLSSGNNIRTNYETLLDNSNGNDISYVADNSFARLSEDNKLAIGESNIPSYSGKGLQKTLTLAYSAMDEDQKTESLIGLINNSDNAPYIISEAHKDLFEDEKFEQTADFAKSLPRIAKMQLAKELYDGFDTSTKREALEAGIEQSPYKLEIAGKVVLDYVKEKSEHMYVITQNILEPLMRE